MSRVKSTSPLNPAHTILGRACLGRFGCAHGKVPKNGKSGKPSPLAQIMLPLNWVNLMRWFEKRGRHLCGKPWNIFFDLDNPICASLWLNC